MEQRNLTPEISKAIFGLFDEDLTGQVEFGEFVDICFYIITTYFKLGRLGRGSVVEEQEFGVLVHGTFGESGGGKVLGVVSFEFSHKFKTRGKGILNSG